MAGGHSPTRNPPGAVSAGEAKDRPLLLRAAPAHETSEAVPMTTTIDACGPNHHVYPVTPGPCLCGKMVALDEADDQGCTTVPANVQASADPHGPR